MHDNVCEKERERKKVQEEVSYQKLSAVMSQV